MRRTIKIKAKDRDTKILIIAKVNTDGWLMRNEVNQLVESLREGLVDMLRKEVIKFNPYLSKIKF